VTDQLKARFSFFPSIIVALAFLITMIRNLGSIVVEKQSKMKEYLRLVGVKWYSIWISWLIRILIIYVPLSLLIAGIGIIGFGSTVRNPVIMPTKKVFETTAFGVVVVSLLVYSLQVAMFTLLLGQIFSKGFFNVFFLN
jgi:ATP-binding cassette, subfamily A (ABC1), member 3